MKPLLVAIAVAWCVSAAPAQQPDLIVLNAKVWTVNKHQPEAEALAVWRDRLVFVGSSDEAKKLAGPKTRLLDLQGRRVVPGFYDSHVHMLGSGLRLSQVALKDAKDEAEFGRLLQEFDKKLPPGRWMLGGDWDHDRALKGELPTAALLDKYVPDRPVFLRRYDGHMGVVNSKVLQMAAITAATADPPGGVVFRKPGTKEPTGLLRDNAMDLVDKLIPATSDAEIVEAVRAALDKARRVGVTSVQDMAGSSSATQRKLFRVYQQLARSDKLTCRIDLRWPLASWKELADLGAETGLGNDWVKIGGVKGFVDGSLGSSTAKMFEPFVNEPNSTGVYVTPLSKLREYILGADKAGINVCVHAIGDRANAELLDLFAEAGKVNGPRDRRLRIEHTQHLRPQDYPRFAELGVIASLQPYHIIDDGRWAEGRIGATRCASSYACRSLLDAGAKIAFGSDWSVAPLNPLPGLDGAVNRRTLDGKHPDGWFPAQKITIQEALEAYTLTSAYAAFEEKDRGSLEVGKLADFVVLSRDILAAKERDKIGETEVLLTVVGGKVVYEKGAPKVVSPPPSAQNPSPMVEHTRAHPRLKQENLPGKRYALSTGTLFLPEKLKLADEMPLLIHFHGTTWLAEHAAAQNNVAVLTVQLGAGSSAYGKPFADPKAFGKLLDEAAAKARVKLGPLTLSGWSAGYGAIRAILSVPEYFERVQGVLLLDGLHTGYIGGKPGPLESKLEEEPLAVFLKFAQAAVASKKRMLVTHTEIFPGTFASTTETADWLLKKLELKRTPVLKWGPLQTQLLSEVKKGQFTVLGFAGNSAPDHVDLLHGLGEFVERLQKID